MADVEVHIDLEGQVRKYGVAPKLGKHYSKTCDDVGAKYKYILYGGEDEFPVGDDTNVVSLRGLMD